MTNGEFKVQLEKRTAAFSVGILRMLRAVPIGIDTRNIRDQIARSATAIGANYREANRAESRSDFIHKIAITAKEASESEYWLTILYELHPQVEGLPSLLSESGQLVRIFDKIRLTATRRST